jgi:hypothetical protein
MTEKVARALKKGLRKAKDQVKACPQGLIPLVKLLR